MRTSVLCLAAALALCSVLPLCSARPGELYVKKQSATSAAASSSAESASSEQIIKKGGCGCVGGCGCGGASVIASKSKSAKSASASSSSSSSSYEARAVSGGCSSLTEVQIKEKYAQLDGEALDVYFKRIVARSYSWTSTTESYVKTMSTVWKDFATLPLWYDTKYLSYSKQFYSIYFAKQESESLEVYYSRIVKKMDWESETLFARRITVLRDCFPSLDLWTSQLWFEKYTKNLYALEFKKFAEESEADYIKRIFTRDSFFDKTDFIWASRLFLIQEATISSCDLWYNKAYFSYFKSFYSVWYAKQEKETNEAWLVRALSLLPGESTEKAITRITFIKEVTSGCGCWTLDYFKKVQELKTLQSEWLVKIQSTFFPSCGCGGAVSIQKSSSKSSAASSASSSSESSSLVVKA